MKIIKLNEFGYDHAMLGTSLSRNQPIENMDKVCHTLADKDGGHNKFLEFISVWLDIYAPRFWWQQMATYRIGSSWLSESTMYTLTKKLLTQDDFEYPIPEEFLAYLNNRISFYGTIPADKKENFNDLKNLLPEGFIQRRIMVTNYKALRNIILQRRNHKLSQWKYFCEEVLNSLEHPEFIVKNEKLA